MISTNDIERQHTVQRISAEHRGEEIGLRAKHAVLSAKNAVTQKLALVGCLARGFAAGIRK